MTCNVRYKKGWESNVADRGLSSRHRLRTEGALERRPRAVSDTAGLSRDNSGMYRRVG